MDGVVKGHATNLETLIRAAREGALCLLEARRRSDGATVALLCACNKEKDGGGSFVPFATMVEGNPFDMFDPPNPEGGF